MSPSKLTRKYCDLQQYNTNVYLHGRCGYCAQYSVPSCLCFEGLYAGHPYILI